MDVRVLDRDGRIKQGRVEGDRLRIDGEDRSADGVTWLPPCEPTKVVCLARNVAAHAAEHDAEVPSRPEYFLKPPSSVAAHRGTVTVPAPIDGVEYEAELAAVIGARARNVAPEDAMDHVAGLTCMNDLSNRGDQRREINWVRGKAFDGSAPLGPGVVEPEAVPPDAAIELRVDGETRQRGRRDEYAFDISEALSECSRYLTLEPGDVLALGTPAGVGPVPDGAEIEVDIEGIPPLRHQVTYA